MVDKMHYSQSVTEGNKKNFDSQEARLVMLSIKKELDWLKELIAKNPWKKWWEKGSLDDAIKIVDTQWFYKLEANNKVTYNLDKVASYLSIIYNRILKPG